MPSILVLVISISFRLLSGLAVYALNIVVARALTVSDYGGFSFLLSLVTFLVLVCRFGIDRNLLREVASRRFLSSDIPLNDLGAKLGSSCIIVFLISMLVVLFLVLLSQLIISSVDAVDNKKALFLFTLVIIPWALVYVFSDLLRGYGYVNLGLLFCGILVPTLTIIQVFFLSVSSLVGVVSLFLVSTVATLIISALLVRYRFNLKLLYFIPDKSLIKSMLSKAFPVFSGLFVSNLQLNVSFFILGLYFSGVELALYSIGLKTALLLGIFLLAINSVYEPRFAAFYSSGKMVELKRSLKVSILLLLFIAVIVGTPLILFPEKFLLLFGERYQGASSVLMVFASTQILNLVTGPVSSLLIMTNGQLVARNIALTSLAVTVLTALFLIPEYGVMGAALAHSSGIFVKSLLGVFAVKTVFNINLVSLMFK